MNVRSVAVFFFILVSLSVWAPMKTLSMDLKQFQWKNRLLFIFAEDSSHSFFTDLQSQIVDQKSDIDDRDLIVFELPAQGLARMNTFPLDQKDADSIRKRFAIASDTFSLILVGKDGGIKLKRNNQVKLSEVFKLIDSMPMRQREMQQKGQ